MNLYKITDESVDAKRDPVVFVESENIGDAAKRGIAAMEAANKPREHIVIEFICDLDQCYGTM